jgi:predicted nucleic acid-binding Zn ribbon protein
MGHDQAAFHQEQNRRRRGLASDGLGGNGLGSNGLASNGVGGGELGSAELGTADLGGSRRSTNRRGPGRKGGDGQGRDERGGDGRGGGGKGGARLGTSRRQGSVNVLVPAPPAPAQELASCLEQLQRQWQRHGHLAALWRAWPRLAGPQLAPHCQPLRLQAGRLTVGAQPGPWLQALQYNRHQLLGALRAAGFELREVRVEQCHPGAQPRAASLVEEEIWQRHPSRVDGRGMVPCPQCGCPAPGGEVQLWGHCSFCRRTALGQQQPPPTSGPPPATQ